MSLDFWPTRTISHIFAAECCPWLVHSPSLNVESELTAYTQITAD